jgi:AcrR family transcriptional regulator
VAIRDPRGQLFDAAERVLLRDGPAALTSRAVTAEAGVAKGVLHRHFADFDAFLAGLALDRIAGIGRQAADLRAAAGAGSVPGNLAGCAPPPARASPSSPSPRPWSAGTSPQSGTSGGSPPAPT